MSAPRRANGYRLARGFGCLVFVCPLDTLFRRLFRIAPPSKRRSTYKLQYSAWRLRAQVNHQMSACSTLVQNSVFLQRIAGVLSMVRVWSPGLSMHRGCFLRRFFPNRASEDLYPQTASVSLMGAAAQQPFRWSRCDAWRTMSTRTTYGTTWNSQSREGGKSSAGPSQAAQHHLRCTQPLYLKQSIWVTRLVAPASVRPDATRTRKCSTYQPTNCPQK